MHADLSPIEDFVAAYHRFSTLPPESIRTLASQISILYRRSGDHRKFLDRDNPRLYIIRRGAVEVRTQEGTPTNLLCVQETESIREAARRMTEASVPCALIKHDHTSAVFSVIISRPSSS